MKFLVTGIRITANSKRLLFVIYKSPYSLGTYYLLSTLPLRPVIYT